jgi:hypothetical protein
MAEATVLTNRRAGMRNIRVSRLPLLKAHHPVAGTLLPLAGFSEKTINIVAPGCGQLVFDAPDSR